jgi:hypothetical protein
MEQLVPARFLLADNISEQFEQIGIRLING